MIAELSGRRLVAVKEKGTNQILSIHRLLQEKILLDLDPAKFTEVFEKVYCLVRKRYPAASPIQVPESQKWPDCKAYTPHVLSVHRAFKAGSLIEPSISLAQLFYDAGFHVWERQTTAYDGISFLETSEEILNTLNFDKSAKLRADILSILGLFYDNIGTSRRAEGLQRRKEAINIRRKIYEDNPQDSESDVLLANAANDFGYSLLENNMFEEAGKIFETCYKRYCKWGTEDQIPFEYAKFYLNTGKVRMWQGNFPEAIRFIRRAVVLTEKSGGKTWRYWMFQFILACVLLQSGDLQGALDLHLEVFFARKKVCGKHDSTTVLSNYAVGAMHHHLGNLPEAT
jgi:tetratricopeptide (TPR) repeat protein